MKWTAVAAIAAGIVSAASAAEPPMAGTGVGGSPCALFNQINARDPDWAKSNYLSWAQGFMAGSNDERISQKQPSAIVNSQTSDDQWAYLKNYCGAHPNEPFAEGVLVLYLSLPTKPYSR